MAPERAHAHTAWRGRAVKAMGYRRLVTFTRADESGASLRGADGGDRERPMRQDGTPHRAESLTTDAMPLHRGKRGNRMEPLFNLFAMNH